MCCALQGLRARVSCLPVWRVLSAVQSVGLISPAFFFVLLVLVVLLFCLIYVLFLVWGGAWGLSDGLVWLGRCLAVRLWVPEIPEVQRRCRSLSFRELCGDCSPRGSLDSRSTNRRSSLDFEMAFGVSWVFGLSARAGWAGLKSNVYWLIGFCCLMLGMAQERGMCNMGSLNWDLRACQGCCWWLPPKGAPCFVLTLSVDIEIFLWLRRALLIWALFGDFGCGVV